MSRIASVVLERNGNAAVRGIIRVKFGSGYEPWVGDDGAVNVSVSIKSVKDYDAKRLALASALEESARRLRKEVG